MRLKHTDTHGPLEQRYDSEVLRKVTALAARIQSAHQETLTAAEMETIGAEVGLEPAFIRQALAQLDAEPPRTEAPRKALVVDQRLRQEFWSLVVAWGGAWLWLFLGMIFLLTWGPVRPITLAFLTLVVPAPLAAILGFLAGTRKAGFWIGVTLILGLCPPFFRLLMTVFYDRFIEIGTFFSALSYLVIAGPLAGWLGAQGARLRQHYFPVPTGKQTLSRSALLNVLFSLQRQLEDQKQHHAFLSMDVVGSTGMKQGASELAVEYSFGQLRQWIEDVVQSHGGRIQSAAGDGMMAAFSADAGAVRAARLLQEELPRFNREQNRLPTPFRIRCGISAGEVAIEDGTPLGHLHSPIIDRAAALQKRSEPGGILVSGEVTAAALLELGGLTPLPEPVAGEPAFAWRAPSLAAAPAFEQTTAATDLQRP